MARSLLLRLSLLALACLAPAAESHPRALAPLPVRVVVVTTFEIGADTGDTPGEFQTWVERLPLPESLPFAVGIRPLRYDPRRHVLGIVVGGGAINGAASIMALGLDPRFDLSKAYWVVAGIAGINPHEGSIGSAAWARYVVDRDLLHEIDAREIPKDWNTGIVPLTRSRPFEGPPPGAGIFSPNLYRLNPALTAWAYALTADTRLDDSADLQAIRARYRDQPQALAPPHVMLGDEISAMNWWIGDRMNTAAEQWMRYWTDGRGVSVTTAMEDAGILRALGLLSNAHHIDLDRVLVLRTASNYSAPGIGETAAGLLAEESSTDSATKLSAYKPALEAAYRVGSRVVEAITADWPRFERTPPRAPPTP